MKTNKIYSAILSAVVLTLAACTIEPTFHSQVTPETFYDSKDAVWQRFYRPFTHLRWAYGADSSPWELQELGTDAFCLPIRGTEWADKNIYWRMHHHDFKEDLGPTWIVYANDMGGVARCWATVEDLRKVDFDELGFEPGTFDYMKAQLETVAASLYLESLDLFGGMPLYDGPAQDVRGRSSDVETFNLIERLLKGAIPRLKVKTELGGAENGTINRAAAALWLARLYFNAEAYIRVDRYEDAAEICQDIIDGEYGEYDLDSDWTKTFGFSNDTSREIIWSIPCANAKGETDGGFWSRMMPHNMKNYLGNLQDSGAENGYCLTPGLDPEGNPYSAKYKLGSPFAKFHDKDVRKQPYVYLGNGRYRGMFVYGELKNPQNPEWMCKGSKEYNGQVLNVVDQIAPFKELGGKYATAADLPSDIKSAEENSGVRLVKISPRPNQNEKEKLYDPDVPKLRLAEAYYTLAECKLRAGDKAGAATLINEVRKRYFEGDDPDPVTAENLDKYRMLDEWLIEFLGEGRRRTDLIRWGAYITEEWWDHKPSNSPHLNRMPFEFTVFNSNNMIEQNPGYND